MNRIVNASPFRVRPVTTSSKVRSPPTRKQASDKSVISVLVNPVTAAKARKSPTRKHASNKSVISVLMSSPSECFFSPEKREEQQNVKFVLQQANNTSTNLDWDKIIPMSSPSN